MNILSQISKCLLRSLDNMLVHSSLMWDIHILQLRVKQETEVLKHLSVHNSDWLTKKKFIRFVNKNKNKNLIGATVN
jgi:hypothetical protein